MDSQALLNPFIKKRKVASFEVKGLSQHSQQLKPGELFLAYPGTNSDGRAYIQEALKRNPCAILIEEKGKEQFELPKTSVPIYAVKDLSKQVGLIASAFYGHPSESLTMVGVTGTNGKTTTCYLLYQALRLLGFSSAMIGTLGVWFDENQLQTGLTTPDPITLQKALKHLVEHGVKWVAMEVSSHALAQGRTHGIRFDMGAFTNLTQDHLDYHETMEAYGQAKALLFQSKGMRTAVINADAAFTPTLLSQVPSSLDVVLTTTQPTLREPFQTKQAITTRTFTLSASGIEADIDTPWGRGLLKTKLVGAFNLSNVLEVIALLCQYGFPLKDVLKVMQKVHPAVGRMQTFGGGVMPQVIVDYAHTPDALEQVLTSARSLTQRQVWCVFGCGGGRDVSKRALMGSVASKLADKIVITNDNPRQDPPRAIMEDILKGIPQDAASKVKIEEDRESAIAYAIEHALSFDVIVVAGKGHEEYQIIGNQKRTFSDIQCVEKLLGKRR